MNHDPLETLKKFDSDLFDNISATRELAFTPSHLSIKNKILIALAIDAADGAVQGIKTLMTQALEQGATHGKIMDTIRVVRYLSGVGSMYAVAQALAELNITDKNEA